MRYLVALLFCLLQAGAEAGELIPAPDCQLAGIDPEPALNLQQYRGQVVYVDFWASWCPPCLKSFPFMNEMHREFEGKGLQVIAVNLDEQAEDAHGFLQTYAADFAVAFDNASRDCARAFDVKAMPSSYLIDRKGIIRHVHLGFKADETGQLRSLIEQLLAE